MRVGCGVLVWVGIGVGVMLAEARGDGRGWSAANRESGGAMATAIPTTNRIAAPSAVISRLQNLMPHILRPHSPPVN